MKTAILPPNPITLRFCAISDVAHAVRCPEGVESETTVCKIQWRNANITPLPASTLCVTCRNTIYPDLAPSVNEAGINHHRLQRRRMLIDIVGDKDEDIDNVIEDLRSALMHTGHGPRIRIEVYDDTSVV